ncbi:hypothetical protein ACFFWD_31520 [Bradyrhizobium erythrophlei]|uniref:hypothetical protein n=1 Tax=Bradyrhizobium erythrophlei TaxID=1437360 RepID=UPI0035E71843
MKAITAIRGQEMRNGVFLSSLVPNYRGLVYLTYFPSRRCRGLDSVSQARQWGSQTLDLDGALLQRVADRAPVNPSRRTAFVCYQHSPMAPVTRLRSSSAASQVLLCLPATRAAACGSDIGSAATGQILSGAREFEVLRAPSKQMPDSKGPGIYLLPKAR